MVIAGIQGQTFSAITAFFNWEAVIECLQGCNTEPCLNKTIHYEVRLRLEMPHSRDCATRAHPKVNYF